MFFDDLGYLVGWVGSWGCGWGLLGGFGWDWGWGFWFFERRDKCVCLAVRFLGYDGTRCLRAYEGDSVGCELGLRPMYAIVLGFECLLVVTANAVRTMRSFSSSVP